MSWVLLVVFLELPAFFWSLSISTANTRIKFLLEINFSNPHKQKHSKNITFSALFCTKFMNSLINLAAFQNGNQLLSSANVRQKWKNNSTSHIFSKELNT
jgi:hypothetical protein